MRVLLDRTHLEHPLLVWQRLTPATRSRILTGIVVLAAAVLSMAAGYIIIGNRMRLALLIFGPLLAIPGILWISRRFEYVVLALPIAALAIPFELPTGTYSTVPAAMVLALMLCGIWIVSMGLRKTWHLTPSPLNRPMLVFCVTCALSLVWGIVWRDPILNMSLFKNFEVVQIASLLTYFISIGAALLIGNFVQSEQRLRYIVGCFIFFGSMMTIFQIFSIRHGVLNDKGLWGLWTVIPAYALVIAHPGLKWYWRILFLTLIGLNLYQTVFVNLLWKSGWIPTVIAIFAATLLRSWRWFLVLLVAVSLLVYTQQEFFNRMIEEEMNEGAEGRIGMWEINLRVVGDHWLFGTGPAGYAPYYMTYYPHDARSTHNNYLDIIAQFGVVGSLIWLWFAAVSTIEGLRLFREAPPGFLKALALAAISGWIGAQASMFFGDWILPFAYNQTITGFKYTVYTWIWLGMLISIRTILTRQQTQENVSNTQR
jgi:hypothetical protein